MRTHNDTESAAGRGGHRPRADAAAAAGTEVATERGFFGRMGATVLWTAASLMVALVAAAVRAHSALAQSSFGEAGGTLLSDLSDWVLVGTVAAGTFFVLKSRAGLAVMAVVFGAILWGITDGPERVSGLSDSVWGIFGGGS